MNTRKAKHGRLLTVIFTIISLIYVFPIALVVINSFKKKAYISRSPFSLPTEKTFVGLENYINGIEKPDFLKHSDWPYLSQYFLLLQLFYVLRCAHGISAV